MNTACRDTNTMFSSPISSPSHICILFGSYFCFTGFPLHHGVLAVSTSCPFLRGLLGRRSICAVPTRVLVRGPWRYGFLFLVCIVRDHFGLLLRPFALHLRPDIIGS